MEYYSAIKKNEIMPSAAIWMDIEIIILSEVREKKYDITYKWNLKRNVVNNLPAMQEMQVLSLGQEDTLEKEMATH